MKDVGGEQVLCWIKKKLYQRLQFIQELFSTGGAVWVIVSSSALGHVFVWLNYEETEKQM